MKVITMTTSEKVEKVKEVLYASRISGVETDEFIELIAKQIVEALEEETAIEINGVDVKDTEIYVLRQILKQLEDSQYYLRKIAGFND